MTVDGLLVAKARTLHHRIPGCLKRITEAHRGKLPQIIYQCRRLNHDQIPRYMKAASFTQIFRSLLVYKACSWKWLPKWTMLALSAARSLKLEPIPLFFIRRTIFKQFCGGETVDDVKLVARSLQDRKIGIILDYAAEPDLIVEKGHEKVQPSYFDSVAENIHHSIGIAGGLADSMVAIKISGLFPAALLLKLGSVLQANPDATLDSFSHDLEFAQSWSRLTRILDHARDLNVVVAIDAEQSFFQDAIDLFALQSMRKYNSVGSARKPVVINTYQMYRKDALHRLSNDLDKALLESFHFGAKIVRGAYMTQERSLSESKKDLCPVFEKISQTHEQYDSAIRLVFSHLKQQQNRADLNYIFTFATHNESSVNLVTSMIESNFGDRLKSDLARRIEISIAQLYGMSDSLSFSLAEKGFKVRKYIPFGPVKHVIPYLLRRAEENSAIFDLSGSEARMFMTEMRRRAFGRVKPAGQTLLK